MAYAFSMAMSQGMLEKYGVTCDAHHIVEKVKALCRCWDGHFLDHTAQEWNHRHKEPGACIESRDKAWRYNVMVNFKVITSFAEAYEEMERAERLCMYIPCTITRRIESIRSCDDVQTPHVAKVASVSITVDSPGSAFSALGRRSRSTDNCEKVEEPASIQGRSEKER